MSAIFDAELLSVCATKVQALLYEVCDGVGVSIKGVE